MIVELFRKSDFDTMREWRNARDGHDVIYASEVSSLLGKSPWKRRDMLLEEKVLGVAREVPDNDAMFWGRALESALLERAQRDMRHRLSVGRSVYPCDVTFRNDAHPHFAASPDGLADTPDGLVVVECKDMADVDYLSARLLRERGTPPEDTKVEAYWAQVQVQIACTGATEGYLSAKCGKRYLLVEIQPDPEFISRIDEEACLFWAEVAAVRQAR